MYKFFNPTVKHTKFPVPTFDLVRETFDENGVIRSQMVKKERVSDLNENYHRRDFDLEVIIESGNTAGLKSVPSFEGNNFHNSEALSEHLAYAESLESNN